MADLNPQSFYNSLQTELMALDEQRLETRQALSKIKLIWIPSLIAGIIISFWFYNNNWIFFPGLLATLFIYGFGAVKVAKTRAAFTDVFKSKVIGGMLKKIDTGFTYTPQHKSFYASDSSASAVHLKKVNLLPTFRDGRTEDHITGTIKGNAFQLSEMKLNSGGKNNAVVFHGVLMSITLPKSFPSTLHIFPDKANILQDGFLKLLHIQNTRGEVVTMSDPTFEKAFKVYTRDPGFAASFLTQSRMNKITAMNEKLVGKSTGYSNPLQIAFVDNTITVAVWLKNNLFEPNLNQPVNDLSYFEENSRYLILFLGLAGELVE